jgi:hypothetical protein
MKFKGTIVITDPCYLDNGMDNQDNLDLWEASNYGRDLSVFGCSQWISESTVYGDWSCTTYQGTDTTCRAILDKIDRYYDELDHLDIDDPMFEDLKDNLYNKIEELSESFNNQHPTLGRFCADAGMVCVVYLDELTKINPHFEEWAKKHHWCATIIKDFDGEVQYDIDDNDNAHIIGKGNINFYTIQTGL